MSTYTAGWITVPGKGKRWRTTEGKYMTQRPAGSAPGVLDAIRNSWSQADAALGGWLPGGGTGNPASGAASAGVRSTAGAVKTLRDKAIAPLPLPERLAITAMTGGTRDGGPVRTLSDRNLREIKGIADSREKTRQQLIKNASSFGPMPPWVQQKVLSGNQVSAYGTGSRDLHLGLGSFGLYDRGKGPVVIEDVWKVDRATGDRPFYKNDLGEGGNVPQVLFEAMRRSGLYRRVKIEVQVPRDKWEQIQGVYPVKGAGSSSYARGPQYEVGPHGVFFQGRNVAPWGMNPAWGAKREKSPSNPLTDNKKIIDEKTMKKLIDKHKELMGKSVGPTFSGPSSPANFNSFGNLGEY